jgi:hypothetical protein
VSSTAERAAAATFLAAGLLFLSTSWGTAAATMDDGNEKEEESGYGKEFDCCLYLVQLSAKSRAVKL